MSRVVLEIPGIRSSSFCVRGGRIGKGGMGRVEGGIRICEINHYSYEILFFGGGGGGVG